MHFGRQPAADLLEIFEHAGARPVKVRSVLEDDVDIGIAEHRLRANGLHMRRGQKAGHDRVGDLIFDDVWRLSQPSAYE